MKKIILLLVLFVATLSSNAQSDSDLGWLFLPDRAIPLDKQTHVVGFGAIGFVSYLVFEPMEWTTESDAIFLSLGTTTFLGILKELNDINTTGFDFNDIGANTIGWALGVTSAYYLRKWAKNREMKRKLKQNTRLANLDSMYYGGLDELEILLLKQTK